MLPGLLYPLTQWLGAAAGASCARAKQEWCFLVCSSGPPSYPVAWSSCWCRLCTGAACQSWRLLEDFLFYVPLPRYSHMEIWTLPLPSYLSVLRCLGVASGARCIRDACFVAFGELHIFSTCGALRSWRSSPFRRMEKCAQVMLRVAVSLRAVRTLKLDIISTSSPKGGEERGAVAAGVIAEDLGVFNLDRVLQCLVEQIIEADMVCKAGFNSGSWSRTSKRGSGGEVLRRDRALGLARAVLTWKLGHYFFVSLFWQTLFLVFMRQSTEAFENFIRFLREDEVGS